MRKEYLYLLIGILAGALIGILVSISVVNSNNMGMMRMMGMSTQGMMQSENQGMMRMHEQMMGDDEMTMGGMVNDLKGKSGDDFDKSFIEQMVVHHQGAIDMAKLAKEKAGHDEIKSMADDIISAQSNEIEMMRKWQKDWNY